MAPPPLFFPTAAKLGKLDKRVLARARGRAEGGPHIFALSLSNPLIFDLPTHPACPSPLLGPLLQRAAATAEEIAGKMAERHAQSLAGVCQELFCSPESEAGRRIEHRRGRLCLPSSSFP